MTENDKREFYETIDGILKVYGEPVNEDVLGAWWNTLKRWPLELVRRTLDEFIFYGGDPVPKSIIKRIRLVTHD